MPRNGAVDYPQVCRSTPHDHFVLAPPQDATADNRYSWQNTSNGLVSPSRAAEQELEAGNVSREHERRQSEVPPLPVLPHHLSGPDQIANKYQEQTQALDLPAKAIHSHSHTQVQPQQPYLQHLQQPQQTTQFRPDIPRHFQQQQQQQQQHLYSGPPVSYEASQAAHQPPFYAQQKMQEQAIYPGHQNGSQTQLSAHALPLNYTQQVTITGHHESTDEKPSQISQDQIPGGELSRSRATPSAPIHVGPDINPLSPTSPVVSSNSFADMQTFPPPHHNSNATPEFPQMTTYSPRGPIRGGTWHHSLGSCAEPTTCLSSIFCPCIVYGKTQYRLSLRSAKKDPTNMLGYSSINGSCLAWSVLCGVNILLTTIQHTRVRKAYEMDDTAGNVAGDCIKSTCCCCCVLAQDEKEVKLREERGRKGDIGMGERGYQSPRGMTFSPPPR